MHKECIRYIVRASASARSIVRRFRGGLTFRTNKPEVIRAAMLEGSPHLQHRPYRWDPAAGQGEAERGG